MTKPTPNSLEGLIDAGFKLLLNEDLIFDVFLEETIKASGINYEYVNSSTMGYYERHGRDKKVCFRFFKNLIASQSKTFEFMLEMYDFPLKFINEDLLVSSKGVTFSDQKYNVLFKPFREGIRRIVEAGITDKMDGKNENELFGNMFKTYDSANHDNVVLTTQLLGACFFIWLGCVGISILVFIMELIKFRCENTKRNQINCDPELE